MHKIKQVNFKSIIIYIDLKLLFTYYKHCLSSIILIKKIKKINLKWFKILNKFGIN